MALIVANRVKENTSTTGVGGITFTGSPNGFQPFSGVMTNGDITYYVIEENDKWEVGIGTFGSNNMTRTTILASSNGGSAISLGGSGIVSLTYPAEKATYLNENDEFVLGASGLLFTNGTVFKEAKLVELTDVLLSGTPTSSTIIDVNVTSKGLSIGDRVGSANSSSVIIGYGAASGTTSGYANVVVGAEAATNNQTGFKNVHIGNLSGPSDTAAATLVYNAVSVGYQAGSKMRHNTTALGYLAGYDAYEVGFVAVGAEAGYGIGSYSVGIGNQAMYSYSDDYAVGVGYQAGHGGGGENAVWIGHAAGKSSTAAERSIGIGKSAGQSSTGDDAIYIGNSAGKSNTSDDYLFIGNGAPSSNRTLIKGDMQSKRLAIGAADVSLSDTLYIGIADASDKGLVVKGAASQSADLTQWVTSADAPVASISNSGVITANALFASGQGLELASATPITTANTLYNVGGDLYFNGGAVSSTVSTADLTYVSGIAVYASGQAASLNYASGLTATNATNITATTAVANYASGQSTSLNYVSGVANYTSGVVTGGNPTFGNMYVDEYIYHNGDTNTYIRLRGDQFDFVAGGRTMLTLDEAGSDIVTVNDGANDVDFQVKGDSDTNLIRTDAANDLVGIGTSSPAYKLDVFGHDAWVQASGIAVGNSGVVLANNAPAVTTNTLYNDGGTLKFNGSAIGGGDVTTAQLEYVSGVAVYGSGQAQSLGYASGVAIYASGQATSLNYASGLTATNASNISTNTSNISTNTTNITSTTAVANYASGQATSLNYASGLTATNASNISTNTTNITATTSVANYASGQATSLNYASGLTATNASNISTNTTNITSTTAVANYASGQATSLNVASGVANYASGQAIENEGDILSLMAASGQAVYASGNTSNIHFGSNAEGDLLYHDGSKFIRLPKGTDSHVLTMDGNVPAWEAATGGGGDVTTAQLEYVSGVAVYGSGQAQSLGYASGVAVYASGLAITNLVEDNSIYLGNDPSSTTSTAERNIAIGTTALDAVTTADDNIAIGYNAGTAITTDTSSKNILIGSYAGENLTTNSDENVFIGYEAGHGLVDYHDKSVIIGYHAGYSSSDDRASYTRNVHIGYQAGMEGNNQYTVHLGNQAGEYNAGNGAVAIGDAALKGTSSDPISTSDTVAIGAGAGNSSTGDKCVYLGHNAGASNTSDKMLFIGWDEPSQNETIIKADMENKHVAIGVADVTLSTDPATLQVYVSAATDKGLLIRGAASQSDDLTSWQTSAGAVVSSMTASGVLNVNEIVASGAGASITVDGNIVMRDADLSHAITIKSPDVVSTSYTLPLPSGIGTNGQVLTTDGVQTYWSTVSGGGGGDIEGVTAGNGLSGGGTSGTVTLNVEAAQTVITSLFATDIKIGEDDETKIDFEDADKINFYANNEKQLVLEDGALYPGADNIIDLGKSDNEFKDAFFDGTVTADAFAGPLTGNVTGNADTVTNGVYTSNNLSVMASTTSAQLAGVISDETGTGSLVFASSPTLVTPALGTPSALVGTNISGTAASLTAGKVTVSDSTANTNFPVAFHDESNALLDDTGAFIYNPSTGLLTATAFAGDITGDVTGNADTATALATGRTIAMTGDVAWTSASFTGAGNVTGTSTIQADAIETAMIEDDAVTYAKIQNVTNARMLGNNAGSDGVVTEMTKANVLSFLNVADGADVTTFTLAGDGGSNQTITAGNTLTVAGGNGITTTGAATDTVSIAVDAAQTTITSILATDLKIGEDDQTKIDFEDDDKINFYAGNEKQLILEDGALYPGSDNIIDLGKSDNEFKNAYFDGTVTSDAFAGPLTGNVTGNADTATALANGRTIGMTGDVVWTSASFDGTGNVTGTSTIQADAVETAMIEDDAVTADKLANTAVTAGSYTAADITVDAQGRITAAANGTIALGSEVSGTLPVANGGTGATSAADARTNLGLGTAAVLDTGISNTNVPKFTTGVADDDFLRVNGTAIEGRSASEVLSDISAVGGRGNGAAGNVAFWSDANTITDDPNQLYWDASDNQLGVGTGAPTSTLAVSGNLSFKPVTITDSAGQGDLNWTGANKQYATSGVAVYYLCETGGTSRTINLPDPAIGLAGRTYSFKKIDSGAGFVTVQPYDDTGGVPAGGYIDGDNAVVANSGNVLFAQYDTISATCAEGTTDGRFEWHIVQEKVTPHAARLRATSTQDMAYVTATKLEFDTCDYSTVGSGDGEFADNVNDKFLIKRKGRYHVFAQYWFANFDGPAVINIYKNNSAYQTGRPSDQKTSDATFCAQIMAIMDLDVGDYLEVYASQWNSEGESGTVTTMLSQSWGGGSTGQPNVVFEIAEIR